MVLLFRVWGKTTCVLEPKREGYVGMFGKLIMCDFWLLFCVHDLLVGDEMSDISNHGSLIQPWLMVLHSQKL